MIEITGEEAIGDRQTHLTSQSPSKGDGCRAMESSLEGGLEGETWRNYPTREKATGRGHSATFNGASTFKEATVYWKAFKLAMNIFKDSKKFSTRCFWPLALCILFLTSCDTKRIYEENIDIPKYIWNLDFKPEFRVNITDTTLLYNVYVNVRHTKFYPNSNMWVLISTKFPDGKQMDKRVELTLADKQGKWYGDCLGDICDIRIPIQINAYFQRVGEYTFRYEQIMRTDNLPFVMSMGLRMEKAGMKDES